MAITRLFNMRTYFLFLTFEEIFVLAIFEEIFVFAQFEEIFVLAIHTSCRFNAIRLQVHLPFPLHPALASMYGPHYMEKFVDDDISTDYNQFY